MADWKSGKEFLNVYNFVPFAKKKAMKYSEQDEHTGVIIYSITTKTPLFIPNTSNDRVFRMEKSVPVEHKSYDFYSYREMEPGKVYDDLPAKPVIPGSELRGMIRGIYETLTDSCMGVLNSDIVPSLRTNIKFQPGLIHRCGHNKYELVEAEDYIYRNNKNRKEPIYKTIPYIEGQRLYFPGKPGKRIIHECSEKPSEKYKLDGYLIKGMGDKSLGKKHNAHIFRPGSRKGKLTEEDLDRLKGVLKSYQMQPEAEENSYQEYTQQLEKFLLHEERTEKAEEYFPVYYSLVVDDRKNRLFYLAPACITREMSHHSIGELAGEFAPCRNENALCPSCDLFGRIGKTNENSQASKLRFSDAYPEKEMEAADYYESFHPITLQSLAEPKLGNVEFYLQRPAKSDFWTYDYYVSNGKLYIEPGKIRGRKYYWHQPGVKLPSKIEKNKLNKTVRPVKREISFIGKVYFDKISQKQLDQMVWILNCGDDERNLAYKLGAGKPLGLGSVKCRVIKVTERIVGVKDGELSYEEKSCLPEIRSYDEMKFSQSCKSEFLNMNSLDTTAGIAHICYPITEEQIGKPMQEGFQWFAQNHKRTPSDKRTRIKTFRELPPAADMGCLPCKIREDNRSNARSNAGWKSPKRR